MKKHPRSTKRKNRPAPQASRAALADRSMHIEQLEPRWTLSGLGVVESLVAEIALLDVDQSQVIAAAQFQPSPTNQRPPIDSGDSEQSVLSPYNRDESEGGRTHSTDTNSQPMSLGDGVWFSSSGPVAVRLPWDAAGNPVHPAAFQPGQPAGGADARQVMSALAFAETSLASHGQLFSAMGNPIWRSFDMPPRWGNPAIPPGAMPQTMLPTAGLTVANQAVAVLQGTGADTTAVVAAPQSMAVGATSDTAPFETAYDPLHVETPIVKDQAPYLTRTATVPELDFSQELGGESGVSSEMAQIERVPSSAVVDAVTPGDATLLDIAASDAAVQKASRPDAADAGAVVSRAEIALDHVMAQAYAFALNATEGLPAVAQAPAAVVPVESRALPPRSADDTPAAERDRHASRSEPRRAGVDAVAILSVAGAQVLLGKRRKEEENEEPELRAL